VPATRITHANSHQSLKVKIIQLTADLLSHAFPTTLKPRFSLLLEKVASRSSDLDVWTAVTELLDPTVSGAPSVAAVDVNRSAVRYLRKDWSNRFIGNSLYTLQTVIRDFERQKRNVRDGFYSRTLIFLQSSGVGKSRLADTFGQTCLMINYVLREKGARGFPPADDEILSLMQKRTQGDQEGILYVSPRKNRNRIYPATRAGVIWYHSLAVGVLQASFEELYKWVKESSPQSPTDLAALRHGEMTHNFGGHGELSYRSEKRIKFCQDVAKRAEEIAIELIGKETWRRVFDIDEGSAIRLELTNKTENHLGDLWNAAKRLTQFLESLQPKKTPDPPLVVVFDEASSLLKDPEEEKQSPGRYVALNRIMSCLKEYRIWFFIISTDSQVGVIVPPDDAERSGDYAKDPSLRYVMPPSEARLRRIPPFLAFPPDIEDVEAMQDPNELGKTLSEFGTQRHMAMFGRRLWYAYLDDPQGMDRLAKQKLIGGVQTGTYQAHNVNHVFAALSFRLSLDACWYNSKAVHLIKNAVNEHMRVVLAMDDGAGIMHTMSPSEPIIAKAAMEYLCTQSNWSASIITLVTELIEKGMVEKGLKGELYARLMFILTHDWIRCCRKQNDRELRPRTDSDRELQGTDSDQELQGTHSDRELHPDPYFLPTFTVREFLMTLYDEKHKSIANIDEKILRAKMNFTHFTTTDENLCPEALPDLFVDLLRRGAALQLAPAQPTYDILIPIYFGDENERLDPFECGCIVAQVKNRNVGTTPSTIFKEDFTKVEDTDAAIEDSDAHSALSNAKKRKTSRSTSSNAKKEKALENASTDATKGKEKKPIRNGEYFVFQEMKKPILFLLLDLGFVRTDVSIAPAIEVSYTSKEENIPRVWAIHSRGHGETVFSCLSLMRCEYESKMFFKASVLGSSLHDRQAQRNHRFHEIRRSFRYPSATEGTDNSKTQSRVEGGAEHGSRELKRKRGQS
jgi:hypothetical protein